MKCAIITTDKENAKAEKISAFLKDKCEANVILLSEESGHLKKVTEEQCGQRNNGRESLISFVVVTGLRILHRFTEYGKETGNIRKVHYQHESQQEQELKQMRDCKDFISHQYPRYSIIQLIISFVTC